MATSDYETLRLLVRAPRVAASYETGEDWRVGARQCLRWLSGVWGGGGGVVLPWTPEARPDEALLRLLRTHDPDVLAHRPAFAGDAGGTPSTTGADEGTPPPEWHQDLADVPIGMWPPEPLVSTLLRWCAPKHPYEDELIPMSVADRTPSDPLTAVGEVVDPERLVRLDLDSLDPSFALMVASRVGDVAPDRVSTRLSVDTADWRALAELAVVGSITHGDWDVEGRWRQAGRSDAPPRVQELVSRFPFRTTLAGLDWFVRHSFSAPAVVVVGDTAEDHGLAVLADRTLLLGSWIPSSLLRAEGELGEAVRFAFRRLLEQRWDPRRTVETLICSISEEPEALEDLVREFMPLDAVVPGRSATRVERVRICPPTELPLENRRLLADPTSLANLSTHPVAPSDDALRLLTAPSTPMPQVADPGAVTWFVDAVPSSRDPLPARTALSGGVLVDESHLAIPESLVRAGVDGHSYWSKTQGLVLAGQAPEFSFTRPLLVWPGPFDVFRALADAAGMTARLSPAGVRARNAVELWGGLDRATDDLVGSVRGLLDAFDAPCDSGAYDFGCAVRRSGYVHFEGARTALATDDEGARDVLDRLLTRRVLRRGLLLRCERCDRLAFYALGSFGREFACTWCEHANTITLERWRLPVTEPSWFYDLDPVVRDLLAQNGDVPLLAVRSLRRRKNRRPVLSTFEVELLNAGEPRPWVELDFVAIRDGELLVGEAKTVNTLGSSKKSATDAADAIARAAVALSADCLVLATSQPAWSDGTEASVRHALQHHAAQSGGPTPQLEILVGVGAERP